MNTLDQRRALIALYDEALPDVYGYLASRCGSASLAEDLTSETFLAAVDAVRRDAVPHLTVAWLIGVARHKSSTTGAARLARIGTSTIAPTRRTTGTWSSIACRRMPRSPSWAATTAAP